jgi:hypothetical protein
MKKDFIKIKIALVVLLLYIAGTSNAQNVHRTLNFKQGDEYQKTTYINSVSILKRGSQQFHVNSSSSVSKSYKIINVTDNGYIVTVATTHITDTLDAFGKKLKYDSAKLTDTTSFIEMALNSLIGKTVTISIDKNGIINDVNDPVEKYATDTLLAFTGIQEDKLVVGNLLGLVADYPSSSSIKKGESWTTVTLPDTDLKISTTYTVGKSSDKYTNLMITSTSTEPVQNSNVNGVLVVDNASGVIMTTVLKTATVRYQEINNAFYSSARRTQVVENCNKVN